jgi:hypothetical protein
LAVQYDPVITNMPRAPRRAEIALLAGSLLLTAAFVEVALRLTGATRPRPTGYAPVNTNRRAMRPQNSHAYRDLERTIPKPAGVHRVLSLGDSFAWGASVEFEDAYPQRLERGLVRRRHERWEVVNLALPGMNSVDQAAQLTGEGFDYQPDLVLLGFVLNDSEDAQAAETRRVEEWAEPRHPDLRWWERSALLGFVGHRLWATLENRRRVSGYLSMYQDSASGWIASREALHTMGVRCREHGVPFVVAIFPLFGNPLDETYPFTSIHEKVARAAAESGAKVVDLLPVYRGLRWDVLVVNGADDEHPNEIAHRLAANHLLHALDEVLPAATAAP